MTVDLNENNFEEFLKNKLAVVDFWASWCGPCRVVSPVIESLSDKYAERVAVGKINADENPALISKFGIEAIPTVVLLKDKKEMTRFVGVRPLKDYCDAIDKML